MSKVNGRDPRRLRPTENRALRNVRNVRNNRATREEITLWYQKELGLPVPKGGRLVWSSAHEEPGPEKD